MLLSFLDSAVSSLGIKFACSSPWTLWTCLRWESYPLHRPIDLVLCFLLTAFCGHTTVFGTYRPSSLLLSKGLSVCYRLECLSLSVSYWQGETLHTILFFDFYLDYFLIPETEYCLFQKKMQKRKSRAVASFLLSVHSDSSSGSHSFVCTPLIFSRNSFLVVRKALWYPRCQLYCLSLISSLVSTLYWELKILLNPRSYRVLMSIFAAVFRCWAQLYISV